MLDYDQAFTDIDFSKLEILFNNIIGEDISNEKIEQILEAFYSFRRHEIQGYTTIIKQLHVLQLFAKVLLGRSSDLTILYNTITVFLKDTRTFLYNLNKQIYHNIKEKTIDLTDYYLVFFNNNEFNFQKDCLDIFFKTTFLDINILDYDDYKSLISNELSNIYYEYLKSKSNFNLDFKFQDIDTRYSIRSQIYESAFHQCKIRELIDINPNANVVLKSYYKFKNRVLGNELQKFYVSFSNISLNDKELALITNADTEFLNNIKDRLPLIYQIISALHIINYNKPLIDDDYTIKCKNHLYKTIYESLYIEFKSEDVYRSLCNNIAINISNSLCQGYYINPVTLKKLNIYNNMFIYQLKEFISEVFCAN